MTVEYVEDKGLIFHTIHRPVQGKPLRDALMAGSDALAHYGICKWLSDDRKNGPVTEADTAWSIEEWAPQCVQGGWKYWADVVPENIIAAGAMTGAIDGFYQIGVRLMVFTTVEEAIEWLDSLDC